MKKINNIIRYVCCCGLILHLSSCYETITDFGFDGRVNGRLVDPAGNIISGDVTTEDLVVLALGEGEDEPQRIRVLGDGTFENTHLFPQVYTLTVSGAVEVTQDYTVDLNGNAVTQDIVATPFISLPEPELAGNPTENSVSINFEMTENDGHLAEERLVYVSTVHYPGQSTGSGPYWNTIRMELDENQGSATIEGLESSTVYYVRIAARAEGTNFWNMSDQLMFETP
ncbi:MAG: hypothetical protein WD431_21990 [Cyclobacteriaceae bacterium]